MSEFLNSGNIFISYTKLYKNGCTSFNINYTGYLILVTFKTVQTFFFFFFFLFSFMSLLLLLLILFLLLLF